MTSGLHPNRIESVCDTFANADVIRSHNTYSYILRSRVCDHLHSFAIRLFLFVQWRTNRQRTICCKSTLDIWLKQELRLNEIAHLLSMIHADTYVRFLKDPIKIKPTGHSTPLTCHRKMKSTLYSASNRVQYNNIASVWIMPNNN